MSIQNKHVLLLIVIIISSIGTEFISSISMAVVFFPLIDKLVKILQINEKLLFKIDLQFLIFIRQKQIK